MTNLVEVSELHAYYGSAHVLFDVNFSLSAGSTTALLGRNGAGKTTVVRALMGADCRTHGAIWLHGRRIDRRPTFRRARLGMGVVPEDRRIYPGLTVRQNLDLARRSAGDRTPVEIEQVVETLPILGPLLRRYGNQLSGGEQQIVAIARALIPNPSVLLLDEPSQGLAPVVLAQVRDALRILLEQFGTTMLITEQSIEFARSVADNVLVIEKGQIVYNGGSDDFWNREDIKERFLAV